MVSWPSLGLKSTKNKGKQLGKQTLCVSPQCWTPERWHRPVHLFQNGDKKARPGFQESCTTEDWVLKAFWPSCFLLKVTFDTIHLYLPLSPWGLYFYICNLCPGVAVTVIYQDIRSCLSFLPYLVFQTLHLWNVQFNLPLSIRFMVFWNHKILNQLLLCSVRIHTKHYFTQKCWDNLSNLKVDICSQ